MGSIIDNGPRRSGRTTRQADVMIQILFDEGQVLVKDHHNHPDSSKRLLDLILQRLDCEHYIADQIMFARVQGARELRAHGTNESLFNPADQDTVYYIIKFKKTVAKEQELNIPQPAEELVDEDIVIPGMLHPKGFNPGKLKTVPVVTPKDRWDRFNNK